jgi:glycine/D-amino acid oxidase-like deaminating enzyme
LREGILTVDKLNEEQLEITENTVKYHGYEAQKIIFCNGLSSMHGKFFSWLPFNPVKGEILAVDLDIEIDFILSRGIFVIPEAGTQCKVGATYDRGITDTAISENARDYLLSKVRKLVRSNIEILGQSAGIRPATRDRRPFIGIHPIFKTIAIFNGFGSKGVSLIPYLSGIFTDHLLSGHKLEPDINIIRYFN